MGNEGPAGDAKWEYAKFTFRSTVFTLVTVIDHLWAVHLVTANVFVQASKTYLSSEHPSFGTPNALSGIREA